jgi:hypothetical protein
LSHDDAEEGRQVPALPQVRTPGLLIKDRQTMKINHFTTLTVSLVALILIAGCGDSLQKRFDKMKETAEDEQRGTVKTENGSEQGYTDEWPAFQSDAKAQIADNEKSLKDLQQKLAAADDKTKAAVASQIDALTKKSAALKSKLDGYKDEGKMNWDAFKNDMSRDLRDISASLEKLKSSVAK